MKKKIWRKRVGGEEREKVKGRKINKKGEILVKFIEKKWVQYL